MDKIRAAAYAKVDRQRISDDIGLYVEHKKLATAILRRVEARQHTQPNKELVEAWQAVIQTQAMLIAKLREKLVKYLDV